MAKKEQTKEEKARDLAISTLEHKVMQNIVGGAEVKQQRPLYGELAFQNVDEVYNTTKANARDELYKQRLDNKDPRNPETVTPPTDYEIVDSYFKQKDEVFAFLSLGDLEDVIKKVTDESIEILPEGLKGYVYQDVIQKAQKNGAIDKNGKLYPDKLGKDEKYVLEAHNLLKTAYTRACALNAGKTNYFADVNQGIKEISEAYKKEK